MILEIYDNRLYGNTIKLTDFYSGVPRYFNKTIFKKSSSSGKVKLGKVSDGSVLWIVPTNEFNIIPNRKGASIEDIEGRLDFIESKALEAIENGKKTPKYNEVLSVEEVKKINVLISKLFNRYDIKESRISLYDGEVIIYSTNDNHSDKAIKLNQAYKEDIEFSFSYSDFKKTVKSALFVSENGEFWGDKKLSIVSNMGNRFPKEENPQELTVTDEIREVFKKAIPAIALNHSKNVLNFLIIVVDNKEMTIYSTDTTSLVASSRIKTNLKDGKYLLSKSILLSTPDKIKIGSYGSFAYFKNYQLWANSPDRFNLPNFDRVIPTQNEKQIKINAEEILLKLESVDSDEVNLTELGIDYDIVIEVQRLKDSISNTKGDIFLYGEGSSTLPIAIKDDLATIVIMPIVQPKTVEENDKIPLNKKMHLSNGFSVIATRSYGTKSYTLDIFKDNEKFTTLDESMTYNPIQYLNSSEFISRLEEEYKRYTNEKKAEEELLKERINTIGKDGVDFIDSLTPRQRAKAEELLSKSISTDDGVKNISLFIKGLIDDGGIPKEYNYEIYNQKLNKKVSKKEYGISIPNTDKYQVLQYKTYFNYANYLAEVKKWF